MLKLIALEKTDETIRSILSAMHMPTGASKVVKPSSPEIVETNDEGIEWGASFTEWSNYSAEEACIKGRESQKVG
jgi:hypothetical protein